MPKNRAQREWHQAPHNQAFERYKCRGECFADAGVFAELVRENTLWDLYAVDIEPQWVDTEQGPVALSDFTMEFSTDMPLMDIIELMHNSGRDLHVMSNTLKPLELYDGKRRDLEDSD